MVLKGNKWMLEISFLLGKHSTTWVKLTRNYFSELKSMLTYKRQRSVKERTTEAFVFMIPKMFAPQI